MERRPASDTPRPDDRAGEGFQTFASHESWLYGVAYRLVKDHESALDLVQDVFLALLRKPPQDLTKPRQLMWVIARRIVFGGKQRRLVPVEAAEHEVDDAPVPFDHAVRGEHEDLIRAAIFGLPEDLQQVVWQRYYEQRSTARIAEDLGLTDRAVRARLQRAHEALSIALGPHVRVDWYGSWWAWVPLLLAHLRGRKKAAAAGASPLIGMAAVLSLLLVVALPFLLGGPSDAEGGSGLDSPSPQDPTGDGLAGLEDRTDTERTPAPLAPTPADEDGTDDSVADSGGPEEVADATTTEPETFAYRGNLQFPGSLGDRIWMRMSKSGPSPPVDPDPATVNGFLDEDGAFHLWTTLDGDHRLLVGPQEPERWGMWRDDAFGNATREVVVDEVFQMVQLVVEAPGRDGEMLQLLHHVGNGWWFGAYAFVANGEAVFPEVVGGLVEVREGPSVLGENPRDAEWLGESWVGPDEPNRITLAPKPEPADSLLSGEPGPDPVDPDPSAPAPDDPAASSSIPDDGPDDGDD